MNDLIALGVDVGGTSVKAGLVTPEGTIPGGRTITFDSKSSSSAAVILDTLAAHLAPFVSEGPAGIAFGFPGPFNYAAGVSLIKGLDKYEALYGVDVGAALRERLRIPESVPVCFVNDAEAYGIGEARFGAAKGFERAVVITLGTGCGSAFLVGGRVVRSAQGVPPGGSIYHLPYRGGTVDDYLSKRGILRLWREIKGAGGEGEGGAGGGPAGRRPVEPTVQQLAERAYRGEPLPLLLFERFGEIAGDALEQALKPFGPDVIVLGGQISKSASLFAPTLAANLASAGIDCRVAQAQHIESSGIIGAAAYGFDLWGIRR